MMTEAAIQQESLNLCINADVRGLIDRAAVVRGKSRIDFIVDAARAAAEETLLNQAVIAVSPEVYAEFLQRLDRTPVSNRRLQKTMLTAAPWE